MVYELVTCPKLPSKRSLFRKVKFHLGSKTSEPDREGEKMMVSVERLAVLPAGRLGGTVLEDVL